MTATEQSSAAVKDPKTAALQEKRKSQYEINREAMAELCELYPNVFSFKAPKPLQIGIHSAIAEEGTLSKTRIRRALNLYVRTRNYIACLQEGSSRIAISGEVVGQVTTEEALHAREKLADIDKKREEKKAQNAKQKGWKRANGEGKKPQTKAERAEKAQARLQSKLEALVNKKSNASA